MVLRVVGYCCDDLVGLTRFPYRTLPSVLVACHWAPLAAEHLRSSAGAYKTIEVRLHHIVEQPEGDFLLSVWSTTGNSVARAASNLA